MRGRQSRGGDKEFLRNFRALRVPLLVAAEGAERLSLSFALILAVIQKPVLLDPFHNGRSVTKADCVRFLRETGEREASFAQLRDVDDVSLLLGLLSDLTRVYDRREESDFRQALEHARCALQSR